MRFSGLSLDLNLSVLKCAIASLVVISPSVIATRPTVSLKLRSTVLSGTTLTLNFLIDSGVKYSELFAIYKPQLPISEIDTQIWSAVFVENHCGSFRGGVFPIEISKYSSARHSRRASLLISINIFRNKAICALLRNMGMEGEDLYAFALTQRSAYREYAGSIVAVGRVGEKPFQTEVSGWGSPYWRSPRYAKIEDMELLNTPVNIAQFRDFIKVSRTGAITRLNMEQHQKLQELIESTKNQGAVKK